MKKIDQTIDVITCGEAMAMFIAMEVGDLSQVLHFLKRVAGAEFNVAVGLARLGLNVAWMSRIGKDSFGQFILQEMQKEKISTELVIFDPEHPTGFQLKNKCINGEEPVVEYFRKKSAASYLTMKDFKESYFLQARHLHITGVAAALSESSYELSNFLADFMRKNHKTISFDPNIRPSLWKNEKNMVNALNCLAFKSNWILPGIKEGRILTGYEKPEAISDFYLDHGADVVIIKLGKEGAYFKDSLGNQEYIPSYAVEVVDTVGAGDGFAVGVISALLEGRDLFQAVKRGNKIGSLVVQSIGDSDGLPNRKQLGDF